MSNYLITGGTGLIGQAIIADLQDKASKIIVLSRSKEKVYRLFGYRVEAIESLDEIPPECSVQIIINLAGEPIADKRWSSRQKFKLWQSRVELTNRLVDWIKGRASPPEVLISGSAVGWYGDGGGTLIDETSPPHPEYTHTLCDAWEKSALGARSADTRVYLLRTGLVISPKGGFLSKLLLPFKFGLGARLADGRQFMPWVHIDDMVAIIQFLAQDHTPAIESGPINACAPNPVTNKEFTDTLAKVLNRPAFLVIPKFILKLGMGEMARLLTTGQNAIPHRLTESGYQFHYNSLQSALANVLNTPS